MCLRQGSFSQCLGGLAMLAASLVVSGLGISVYIRGGLGAGPRDGFMLALMRLTGRGAANVDDLVRLGGMPGKRLVVGLVDGRNVWSASEARKAGFTYHGIGRA